jgi:hypothetical protein
MIRQISVTVLAASLSLLALPTMPSATAVALRGDGYCPPEQYSSDPDCVPRGWRGTGRIGDADEASSRDRFPECMNGVCRNRQASLVATSEADKRNQFPGGRPRQPEHLG